jgi:hypothetical protein
MGSRQEDGTRILKQENLESVRHEGERLSITESDDDTVLDRVVNTSFRPPRGDATRGV